MIVYSINIFALPLLAAVWAVDVYLSLLSLRLLLSGLSSTRDSRFCSRRKPTPSWMACFTVVLAGLILRHLLIWVAVSVL